MKVKILGTYYTIKESNENEDVKLQKYDGYCDKTTKQIVISQKPLNCELGDYEEYRRKVLRREIIHAFLFESGLHENFEHTEAGHDETFTDWVAVQFPKMHKAFKKVGCL